MTKKVASSSWLTQIDYRLIAAEALQNVAAMGRKIEVETRLNHRDVKVTEGVILLPTCGSDETGVSTPRTSRLCIETAVRRTNQGIVWTLERTSARSDPARKPREGIGICR
jgi:hypothetical protein